MVEQIIASRCDFQAHLATDLQKNEQIVSSLTKSIENLQLTKENLRILAQKVEHPALIPLGRNIYVNATIKHTGEYFIDHKATPNSYSRLETLENTIKSLEKRIRHETDNLDKAQCCQSQIEERIKLLKLESGDQTSNKIVSDKGVALQVGEFYEIIEFED